MNLREAGRVMQVPARISPPRQLKQATPSGGIRMKSKRLKRALDPNAPEPSTSIRCLHRPSEVRRRRRHDATALEEPAQTPVRIRTRDGREPDARPRHRSRF
jgi:acyl-CoA thioesterase